MSRSYKTPIGYKGKHTAPDSWAGSTPRGPERWARAAHNALTRPNSQEARLYQSRVALARLVHDTFPKTQGPVKHSHYRWKFSPGSYSGPVRYVATNYYTCSLYCTTMQLQLDYGARDMARVLQHLEENEMLELCTPTRNVRCQCCGTQIQP